MQETLLRALANIDSFQPGTNMSAWLFTILRNHFRSEYRKRRREVEDSDGHHAESLKSQPDQYGHVEFREFREALAQLPSDQREALILVGASGFSYEEAAGSAAARSAPSSHASTEPAHAWPNCSTSTALKISAPTKRLARCSQAAANDIARWFTFQ